MAGISNAHSYQLDYSQLMHHYFLMYDVTRLTKTLEEMTVENQSLKNLLSKITGPDISNHPTMWHWKKAKTQPSWEKLDDQC